MKRYGFKVKKTDWIDSLLDQVTDLPEKLLGGIVLVLVIIAFMRGGFFNG